MELRTGDHYGLQTRVLEIRPNGSDPEDFFKHLSQRPKDYKPDLTTSRIRGEFVVKVQAPPHTRIAWFSAGGSFRTYLHGDARRTKNAMAYAVDKPKGFKVFYQANVPTDTEHWHYNADREVKLEEAARALYIRYLGEPAVNNIRIHAHCMDERPLPRSPVNVTHVWSEDGVRRTRTVTMERPGPYEIVTASEPIDESIELSVPSDSCP